MILGLSGSFKFRHLFGTGWLIVHFVGLQFYTMDLTQLEQTSV